MNVYQRITLILAAIALILAFVTTPLVIYFPNGVIVYYDPDKHAGIQYLIATDYRVAAMRVIVILGVTGLLFFALKGINKTVSFKIPKFSMRSAIVNMKKSFRLYLTRRTILRTTVILGIIVIFTGGYYVLKDYQKNEAERLVNLQQEAELKKIQEENRKKEIEVKLIEEKRRQEQAEQQRLIESFAKAVSWNTLKVKALDNVKLQLKTSWVDGYMRYIFIVTPYTIKIRDARDFKYASSDNSFIIKMMDKDGFELHSIKVPLRSMRCSIDDKGNPISLEINSQIICPMESYLNFARWDALWNF